jgi:pimeloyl-ACP methyl ester carboxylesterase
MPGRTGKERHVSRLAGYLARMHTNDRSGIAWMRPLRGLEVAGLEWGSPSGRDAPVVLVHGWLDHAGTWSEVARWLDAWCVAPDLRGHGRSGWCGPADTYHVAEYVADLDALVTALGGRAHVVGHSLGGAVASLWAGARPERALSVTLVDGLGLADAADSAVTRMVEFLDGVSAARTPRPMADLDEAARRLCASHTFLTEERARELAERGTRAEPGGGVAWAWDPRHRLRSPTPYRSDTHARFLARITCPVVVVRPERSPFDSAHLAQLMSALARADLVEVPGAGHMVPLEAPEAVAAAVSAAVHGAGAA